VKVGRFVFVACTPGYGSDRKVAVGNFSAQMKQVNESVTAVLKTSGASWDRVVKTRVFLVRPGDFADEPNLRPVFSGREISGAHDGDRRRIFWSRSSAKRSRNEAFASASRAA